jgi:hypothetical protein
VGRAIRPSPSSFVRNALGGSFGPVERIRVAVGNIRRKGGGRGCCGNYGDPGC